MKDLKIAIATGLIIVVVALGSLTIYNMRTKLIEKKSRIDALESSMNEFEMKVQSLMVSNEEYSRRCSEFEGFVQGLEELVQALEEELEISRNYTITLEGGLHSLILRVINSTNPPQVVPRRPVFYIGDIVAFKIMYDYPLYGSSIKVWNPDGDLVWERFYDEIGIDNVVAACYSAKINRPGYEDFDYYYESTDDMWPDYGSGGITLDSLIYTDWDC